MKDKKYNFKSSLNFKDSFFYMLWIDLKVILLWAWLIPVLTLHDWHEWLFSRIDGLREITASIFMLLMIIIDINSVP